MHGFCLAASELSGLKSYHPFVRRLILILMIAVLPLRSWAGDVMSIAMHTATEVAGEAMPADCPMHESAEAAESVDHGVGSSSPTSPMCDVCDLCLPFTDLVAPVFTPGGDNTQAAHDDVSIVDLSADTARDLRPPIF
jgi:hypothetical protein